MPRLLIKGAEAALPTGSGSASTFDNATVVRLVNTGTAADHLVTVVETQGGTTVGSFTLMRTESVLVEKQSGHFIFVDRIKDCIRRRGENISSYEVEQAFLKFPEIIEAAAFGVPCLLYTSPSPRD